MSFPNFDDGGGGGGTSPVYTGGEQYSQPPVDPTDYVGDGGYGRAADHPYGGDVGGADPTAVVGDGGNYREPWQIDIYSDKGVAPNGAGEPIGDTIEQRAARTQGGSARFGPDFQPLRTDDESRGLTYTTPDDYNQWYNGATDESGRLQRVPYPDLYGQNADAEERTAYDREIRRQNLGAPASDTANMRQAAAEPTFYDQQRANEDLLADLPHGPGGGLFNPDVPLDASQVNDMRGYNGPWDLRSGYVQGGELPPAQRFADESGFDPTAAVGDGGYNPPDYVNRGERNIPNTGETPQESQRITDALSPIMAYHDEGAALNGEMQDYVDRFRAYHEAVDQGDQERDPQFEASMHGEAADIQQRHDDWQNRNTASLDQSLQDVTAQVGSRIADTNASDASNLRQAAGDANQPLYDRMANAEAIRSNPAARSELTDPNSPLGYGAMAFSPEANAAIEQMRTQALSAYGGEAQGPAIPQSVMLGIPGQDELQRVQQQYGAIDQPRAYYQVQGADGVYAGTWVPVGNDPAQLAEVQQRANLPKDDPQNIRVVSASTFGIEGPPQPTAVPTTHVEQTGQVAAIAGFASAAVFATFGLPLVIGEVPLALAANTGPLIGGSFLAKGTGETVGQTGPFGMALDALGKATGLTRVTDAIANVPIPESAQNPLAMVERAVQFLTDDPGRRLNPVLLAVDIYKNGIANPVTQGNEEFQYTSGLQRAGLEYLATSTIQLHDPRNGLGGFLTVANPINDYRTVFQQGVQQGMTPEQAGQLAFQRTNNGVADVIRTFDLFNPAMYALEVPGLEALVRGLFKTTGVGVRDFLNAGATGRLGDVLAGALPRELNPRGVFAAANSGLDLFTTLSTGSAVQLRNEEIARELFTQIGRVGEKNTALADLYEAFLYRESDPQVWQGRIAEYAARYLGASPEAEQTALALSERLGNGFTARMLAGGANPDAVTGLMETFATALRSADWSARELTAAQRATARAYGLRGTDTALLNDYTAFELAKADVMASLLRQAGLPVIADRNAYQVLAKAGADTLRSLYLLPGATALAAKKIGDEFIRGGLTGVWGLRPADFQLVRTAASKAIARGGAVGRAGQAIEDRSLVRQAMAAGVPLDDYLLRTPVARYNLGDAFGRNAVDTMGRPVNLAGRLEAFFGAPGRFADKYLQTLVSSPTQHLRLSAAYRELRDVPAIVRSFADGTMTTLVREYGVPRSTAAVMRDDLVRATNRQDYHDIAQGARLAGGAIAEPGVPSFTGQSRMTPARETFEAEGRRLPVNPETGKAPLPYEINPRPAGPDYVPRPAGADARDALIRAGVPQETPGGKGIVALTPDGGIDFSQIKSGSDYWASRRANDARREQVIQQMMNQGPTQPLGGSVGQRVTQRTVAGPVDYQYRVVPLDELRTNVPGIQTRPRDTSVVSGQQIAGMVRDFQPDRLLADVGALDTGPMIVGTDRAIESGNGRAMALQRLADGRTPESRAAWQDYQTKLSDYAGRYGIDPASYAGYRNPVLIRENLTPFVDAANATPILERTARERIATDARALSDAAVSHLNVAPSQRLDDVLRRNQEAIRAFVGGVQRESPNAVGGLVDSSGSLTTEGLQRFKAALASKAYGPEAGTEIADRIFYRLDEEYRRIGDAIEDTLPQMARGVAGKPDLNLGPDLQWALDRMVAVRREIGPGGMAEWLDRPRLIPEAGMTEARADLLRLLYESRQNPADLRRFFADYADRAARQPLEGQGGFSLIAPASKDDLLSGAARAARGGTSTLDLAAGGDGGAGYLSPAQRTVRDRAREFGDYRTADIYGTPRGAPRTPAQAVNDAAMQPLRTTDGPVGQALIDRERFRAQVDRLTTAMPNQDVDVWRRDWGTLGSAINTETQGAQQTLSAAKTAFERRVAQQDYQTLVDLRAILRAERLQWEVEHDGLAYVQDAAAKLGVPAKERPTALTDTAAVQDVLTRADRNVPAWWRETSGISAENMPENMPGRPEISRVATQQPVQTTYAAKGAIDRGMADQIRDTGQYEAWRAAQSDPTAIVGDAPSAHGIPAGSSAGNAGGLPPFMRDGYPRQFALPEAQNTDWQGAAQYLDAQGQRFGAMQAGRGGAAVERGNRIVGNFREQTPIGEFVTQGTINGNGLGIALVPFAPFHIHTTQYWAGYFLDHPQAAFAIASALNQYQPDEYGGKQIGNKYVSGLLELSTAAKLTHWAQSMYGYARDVIRTPNGNNPLQVAAKIAGQGLFGNEAYVRPFDYAATPAQAALQSATRPLPGKNDFQGNPTIDKREQITEQGSLSPFTAAANLGLGAMGLSVPRNIVQGVTNPAQPLTNLIRSGAVNAVDAAGGGAGLKGYSTDTAFEHFLGNFAQQNGLDPRVVRFDLFGTGPKTNEQRALAQQLADAFNRQQDLNALGKLSPVHWTTEGTAKGIYPPSEPRIFADNGSGFFFNRDAGSGGRDAGARHPVLDANGQQVLKDGMPQYYAPEGGDMAGYQTARAQIAKSTPVTPEGAPFAGYNRDFLSRPEVAALGSAKQQASLQPSIDANAKRYGAGLPPEQQAAQIAKEQTLQVELAPGFQVGDLFGQPGNLYSVEREYADARKVGASAATLREIGNRIDYVKAQDLQQWPQTKAYFDLTETGKSTVTYGYPAGTSSPSGGTTSPTRTGSSPGTSTGSRSSSSGRTAYPGNAGSSRSATRAARSTSASGNSPQAGNDFYDFYRTVTDRGEKAAVLSALDRAGVNPIGQKSVTAQEFTRALAVAEAALAQHRGNPGGTGATSAATSLMDQARRIQFIGPPGAVDPGLISRYGVEAARRIAASQQGVGGGGQAAGGSGTRATTQGQPYQPPVMLTPPTGKASLPPAQGTGVPAGYFRGRDGKLHKSSVAA